jgi:phytoene dehydrogenase-like protein
LSDGRTVEGRKFVASAIDFPATMQMTGEELFPEPVREKAKSWHWGNHSLVTLHLALKDPPAYRAAAFDPDVSRAYNIFFGMDHIDDVASCFDDCAAKKFPRVLMGNGACNSMFDPSYAPGASTLRSGGRLLPIQWMVRRRSGSAIAPNTPVVFSITGVSMRPISKAKI